MSCDVNFTIIHEKFEKVTIYVGKPQVHSSPTCTIQVANVHNQVNLHCNSFRENLQCVHFIES